jgi:hypothetical protein
MYKCVEQTTDDKAYNASEYIHDTKYL